uniref:Uncharacterized protein n=1 Tax=Anguilla anguilla TaxID=7936 RepID=A0A0E9TUT9_ANGAN
MKPPCSMTLALITPVSPL